MELPSRGMVLLLLLCQTFAPHHIFVNFERLGLFTLDPLSSLLAPIPPLGWKNLVQRLIACLELEVVYIRLNIKTVIVLCHSGIERAFFLKFASRGCPTSSDSLITSGSESLIKVSILWKMITNSNIWSNQFPQDPLTWRVYQ